MLLCLCQTGELSYQRYLDRRNQALIIAHYVLITVQITLLFAVPFGGQDSSFKTDMLKLKLLQITYSSLYKSDCYLMCLLTESNFVKS